jgi:putative ABC transport system permease protein
MPLTDFTIIRKSMTSRLFSTVTTALTVAIAVGLMLVLLSMRDAGRQAFERGSGNMHLLVSRDASPLESVLNGIFYVNPPRAPLTWAEFQALEQRFPFEYAVPVQQGDSYRGFPTLATTPEFFTAFQPATDSPWRFTHGHAFEKEWEVVLGSGVAAATRLRLHDRIVLTHGSGGSRNATSDAHAGHVHDQFKLEVVGILAPTGTSHDRAIFLSLNSSWVLHAFDRIEAEERAAGGADAHEEHAHDDHDHEAPIGVEAITDADRKITGVYLRVASRPGKDASALLPTVFDLIRRDGTLTVASPADQVRRLFIIVGNVNQIILAMAAAVMVSSGVAIMVALYNSMEQRRRQIAVLRVLGSSGGRIFGLVLTESAILGVLGALGGVVLSFAGGTILSAIMHQRLGLIVRPSYSLDWMLPVLLGAVVLAALAGLVPAVMAYRTPVVKNLKPIV